MTAEPPGEATPAQRFDLSGKVVLVTGGSRGLGRAMALGFAAAGADVVVASRKLAACEEVATEVRSMGRRALAQACHVGRWNELDRLADAAYDEFGQVDVLVNNAGMSLVYGTVEEVTEEMWDKVVDLNLKGVFRLTAVVGSRMKARGRGSVVNVSSTGSIRPTPWIIPYAAAKAGVNAMTGGFARALGPEVRVNCIMPGPFFTDVARSWDVPAFEEEARR
ncbi:MAG TPA: SDR family NAD(P)-dependent oxidoreductase, partial [Acidimicrobiales bacterium]|nr:SDR family NAD(P)-dependent oxidoreductase [Acidimicrobiales bacterium]